MAQYGDVKPATEGGRKRQAGKPAEAHVAIQNSIVISFGSVSLARIERPVLLNSTVGRCSFLCRIYIIYRRQEG